MPARINLADRDMIRRTTSEAETGPAEPSPRPMGWRRRLTLALPLLLLTLAGGLLRFFALDQPVLWGDEVATFRRVTGTFEKLMDILDEQGFVPLHYIAYWALGKVMTLTPTAMRLIPATAGTLFIPAIYFLARQMFDRRTATLAAAFAALSAYSLIYSRDAKMYMHTWLFVTLLVALLLHWLRTKRWWSYLAMILAGATAVMLHATALIVVGLLPAMLINPPARLRKRDPLYFVLAVALILTGPGWYYLSYNKYLARTAIVPASTVADEEEKAEAKHTGLGWIESFNAGIGPAEEVLNSATGYLIGLQWPRAQIDPRGFDKLLQPWFAPAVTIAMSLVLGLLALGALPWPQHWQGPPQGVSDPDLPRPPPPREAQPWPRTLLWLGAWIVLPTYGVFYCRSYEDFASPLDWLASGWHWLGGWWLVAITLAVALVALMHAWRRGSTVLAAVLGLLVIGSAAAAGVHGRLYWLLTWSDWLGRWWVGAPLVALAMALLWWRAGDTLPQRLRNIRRFAVPAGIILLLCLGLFYVWQHLWDQHRTTHPDVKWHSIWMPRYLGAIYPAVILVAAALLRRLPTRPVRWTAIALLLGLNLTQGLARVVVQTEPPLDKVAVDVLADRDDPHLLTAISVREHGGVRYDWFIRGHLGQYYLAVLSGAVPDPDGFRRGVVRRAFEYPARIRAAGLARQVSSADPPVRRLVVWESFPTSMPIDADEDQVAPALGEGWQRVSDQRYQSRQFWTWRHGNWYRRRVYERP